MASPRRGRPPTIDPEQVAAVAVELFSDRGFDTVTMDDIAREARVSRSTLFRLFPMKSDLVWEGLEASVDRLESGLLNADSSVPAMRAVRDAYRQALVFDGPALEVTRHRLQLISGSDALLSYGTPKVARTIRILERDLAQRCGLRPADLALSVAARVISAAVFAAMLWWAASSARLPADVVDDALTGLGDGSLGLPTS